MPINVKLKLECFMKIIYNLEVSQTNKNSITKFPYGLTITERKAHNKVFTFSNGIHNYTA